MTGESGTINGQRFMGGDLENMANMYVSRKEKRKCPSLSLVLGLLATVPANDTTISPTLLGFSGNFDSALGTLQPIFFPPMGRSIPSSKLPTYKWVSATQFLHVSGIACKHVASQRIDAVV